MAANQFLTEMADEHYMHIEFVPGNYESNPGFEYFVLVIKVGEGQTRNPAKVKAWIVSADVWKGVTVTTVGFRKVEALALETLQSMKDKGDHISLVGYDISVKVDLETEANEPPHHLIYLDWKPTSSLPVTEE